MTKRSVRGNLLLAASAAASTLVSFNFAAADTITWVGGGTTNRLENGTNWSTNPTAPGTSDIANFGSLSSALVTNPTADIGISVGGIVIDNSGFDWTIDRSGTGTNPRSVTIGASGITMTGSGTTNWGPVTTLITTGQTWNIGVGGTLNFITGTAFGGTGPLTVTGGGTVILPGATNSNTGGIVIDGATVVNQRSTNGAGATGALVSVLANGVYEARGNNIASSPIKLFNGSTMRGVGSGVGIATGQAFTIDSAADSNVTIESSTLNNSFAITPSVLGGTANSLINITGAGIVTLANGSSGTNATSTYMGGWNVQSGASLRLGAGNSLGVANGVGAPLTLAGGTLAMQLGANGSNGSSITVTSNIAVTSSSTITVERASTANTGNTTRTMSGTLTIGNSTLNFRGGPFLNGAQTALLDSKGSVILTGNATFDLANTVATDLASPVTLAANFGAVSDGGNGYGITKSGSGNLFLTGANTYTGGTTVTGGFFGLSNGAGAGFTTSKVVVANGATFQLNSVGTGFVWNTKADISGFGRIQMTSTTPTFNLQGASITPGGAAVSGLLTISGGNTTLSVDPSNSDKNTLVIDVTGAGNTAGIDYDRLVASNGLTGLANTDLIVNISGSLTDTDLSGDTIRMITSTTNYTGLAFNSIALASHTYTITYGNGFVELSGLTSVPEPAGLSLIGIGAMSLLRRRRRSQ